MPNSRIANGNHAMDGIVCRPVISEPTARRSGRTRATRTPMTVPTMSARANPSTARESVVPIALQKRSVPSILASSESVVAGEGST